MNRSLKKSISRIAAVAVLSALAVPAGAITVTIAENLVLTRTDPGIQQTLNDPCVIGEPSCKGGSLGMDILPPGGSVSVYADEYSTGVTVNQVAALLTGTSFGIGIDLNQANGAGDQYLDHFVMEAFLGGVWTQLFAWNTSTALDPVSNGNGYSDFKLTGFDLAGLSGTTLVRFGVDMHNVTDGREQFWIFDPKTAVIPLPAGGLLLLSALGLIGGIARRRKATTA